MTDTFAWRPTTQTSGTANSAVSRAQFGDGYAQSVPDGLNARSRTYSLNFVGKKAQIAPIVAFLDSHIGQSFLWEGPWGVGLYYCDTYNDIDLGGSVFSLTATFEQTFQP